MIFYSIIEGINFTDFFSHSLFFSYSKVHNGNIPQLQDWLFAQEFLTSAFVIL